MRMLLRAVSGSMCVALSFGGALFSGAALAADPPAKPDDADSAKLVRAALVP